jgi:hypothetical protein
MHYSTRYMGLIISERWTCIRAITKFELRSATYIIRQHSELITDCSNTAFYPLDFATPLAGFQAMMNRVLAPYLGKFNVVYLDDVMI